jgi:hypothetical protein
LFEAGHKEKATGVFQKSLSLKENQPEIRRFMKDQGLLGDTPS